MQESREKAVVHVSGTLLRRTWYTNERHNCIVVRPAGEDRENVAYVVNGARFDGPSEMVFDVKPRDSIDEQGRLDAAVGHVGNLPGFDNAILVYLRVEEDAIHVQANEGDEYVPFAEFRRLVEAEKVQVRVLNPMIELNC
jgi:hypothetical protein